MIFDSALPADHRLTIMNLSLSLLLKIYVKVLKTTNERLRMLKRS